MPRSQPFGRRRSVGVILPEMNVTPLVDVVLVLLIIFMVVAPRLEQDVALELPAVRHPDTDLAGGADPLRVSVPRSGEFYLGQQRFDLDGVVAALRAAHELEPQRRVAVRADTHLRYGDVRQLLEKTQALGLPGVSLMAAERYHAASEPGQ